MTREKTVVEHEEEAAEHAREYPFCSHCGRRTVWKLLYEAPFPFNDVGLAKCSGCDESFLACRCTPVDQ